MGTRSSSASATRRSTAPSASTGKRRPAFSMGEPGGITAQAVSKTYRGRGTSLLALQDVHLRVEGGTFVSLVGPSGCGKSTLLKVLAGLEPPSQGSVRVGGEPVTGPKRSVGIMFQTPVLFAWRTVIENVLLPIEVFGWAVGSYRQRALDLLASTGLAEFAHAYPHELSGGMQQRVALCRLLIFDPQVLLMDEPFGSVDEFLRERLDLQLLRLWERDRKTVVFVTHSIHEAVFLSDRVVAMATRPGRVLDVVDVDLPRPRQPSIFEHPDFLAKVVQVRRLI